MNKQHVTLLVLLDLSAAFDIVDPSILLTRLRSKLGLNRTALSWFCSYLSGRTQRTSVQGALSNVFHLRYGVPQGSCLGPLLFNIYSSKIFDIVGRHLPKVHCYADDSHLYLSFNPSCAFSQWLGCSCFKSTRSCNWSFSDSRVGVSGPVSSESDE